VKTSPLVPSYKEQKETNFEEKNGRKYIYIYIYIYILASVYLAFHEFHLEGREK
jgi:hypothetical protein